MEFLLIVIMFLTWAVFEHWVAGGELPSLLIVIIFLTWAIFECWMTSGERLSHKNLEATRLYIILGLIAYIAVLLVSGYVGYLAGVK